MWGSFTGNYISNNQLFNRNVFHPCCDVLKDKPYLLGYSAMGLVLLLTSWITELQCDTTATVWCARPFFLPPGSAVRLGKIYHFKNLYKKLIKLSIQLTNLVIVFLYPNLWGALLYSVLLNIQVLFQKILIHREIFAFAFCLVCDIPLIPWDLGYSL